MEIPDALRLIGKFDLTGMIVTGDAMFCRKPIASKVVARGGDHILTVRENRRELREEIGPTFGEPVFPLVEWSGSPQAGHGRIDRHRIAVLPAEALGEDIRMEWPTSDASSASRASASLSGMAASPDDGGRRGRRPGFGARYGQWSISLVTS